MLKVKQGCRLERSNVSVVLLSTFFTNPSWFLLKNLFTLRYVRMARVFTTYIQQVVWGGRVNGGGVGNKRADLRKLSRLIGGWWCS